MGARPPLERSNGLYAGYVAMRTSHARSSIRSGASNRLPDKPNRLGRDNWRTQAIEWLTQDCERRKGREQDAMFRLELFLGPIFDGETSYSLELALVVCDNRQPKALGMGGNPEIVVAY
jgi:hypothetical protein